MDLLLTLLRGVAIGREVQEPEWIATLALSEEHHVSPFVAAQIRRSGAQLPETVEAEVERIERESAISGFLWCAELRGLLREFARAGIPLLPLKGPFLARRIYGSESLRMSRDLDLLVRQQDVQRAETLLASLGFAPTAIADDYHRPWLRGTTGVELHFNVENPFAFDFGIGEAWENAALSNFAGEPAWKFAEADELRFLALHGVRHRFDRLSLVLDLALAMERCASSVPLASLGRWEVGRLRAVLGLGVALAQELRPSFTSMSPQPKEHIARLAERVWTRLLSAPPETIDWQARHRFYLELESSLSGRLVARLRHARILWNRLIPSDYAFAKRFGCERRWQAWLLRPVRLISARLSRAEAR